MITFKNCPNVTINGKFYDDERVVYDILKKRFAAFNPSMLSDQIAIVPGFIYSVMDKYAPKIPTEEEFEDEIIALKMRLGLRHQPLHEL